MSVFISQSRPSFSTVRTLKYGQPITGMTMHQFATAANSLAAGRGFAHVSKSWSYDRDPGDTGAETVEHLVEDPHGLQYSYNLTIPQINPLAESVGLVLVYQGHDTGTSSPSIKIKMTRISDGQAIDNPAGGYGILLSTTNGQIEPGGKTEEKYNDLLPGDSYKHLYKVRVISCISDEGLPVSLPSGARALKYSSSLAAGDGVRITIDTENVRLWSALAYEIPLIVMDKS